MFTTQVQSTAKYRMRGTFGKHLIWRFEDWRTFNLVICWTMNEDWRTFKLAKRVTVTCNMESYC